MNENQIIFKPGLGQKNQNKSNQHKYPTRDYTQGITHKRLHTRNYTQGISPSLSS
jgi:hypothetical protein